MKHAKVICFAAALLFLFLLVACGETSISSEHNDGDEDVVENMEESEGDAEENEQDGDVTEEDGDTIPDGDEEGLETDVEDWEIDGDSLETDSESLESDDGCEPDSTWCEENTLHVCDDTGREYVPEDCETDTCIEPESAESFCRPEHALGFDGSTGYVQLSDDLLARKLVHSTVEVWMYWRGAREEDISHIYAEGHYTRLMLKLGPVSSQYVQFAVHCLGDSWSAAIWYGILPEGWHHIAAINTPNKRVLFVDGEPVAEANDECQIDTTAEEPSFLGASSPSGEIFSRFNGLLDEVRISNVVRYEETFTPEVRFEPDEATVALWHLDEGSGDTATDEVSGLVAPLVGGVEWAAGKTDH